MQKAVISVKDFSSALDLALVYEGRGELTISESEINRPGLQLSGFLQHFANDRVQLIGNAEMHYIIQLPPDILEERVHNLLQYDIPCIVFARSYEPPELCLREAQATGTPLFSCSRPQPR